MKVLAVTEKKQKNLVVVVSPTAEYRFFTYHLAFHIWHHTTGGITSGRFISPGLWQPRKGIKAMNRGI